jgi:hypothetical protein
MLLLIVDAEEKFSRTITAGKRLFCKKIGQITKDLAKKNTFKVHLPSLEGLPDSTLKPAENQEIKSSKITKSDFQSWL